MFSFPNFIRRTPADNLRAYFVAQFEIDPEIDWAGSRRELQSALAEFVKHLPRQHSERVYADFEQVHQLCDDVGQRALRTMFEGDLAAFDALDGNEARGLSVLVSNPCAFRRASSTAYSERFYNGRSWSRYYVAQPSLPSEASETMAAFEAELKELFIDFDGSGRKIMVESFEVPNDASPLKMYSIYVESSPLSNIEFAENGPERISRRPVIEATVCFNMAEATIDIVAKGGRPTRDAIGEAFVRHLLASDAELLPVSRRMFRLDRLRHQIVFETDPQDGIKHVRVTALRLRDLTDTASRITIETTNALQGIHAVAEGWFGDANPLQRGNWQIEQARLQIVFHPDHDGGREKRVLIELRAPNGSNLKEQERRHELISSKYLLRWGLLDAGHA